MTEESYNPDAKCETCGQTNEDCIAASQSAIVDISMVQAAVRILPPDYKEVLERILQDWRTHTLPECNKMAIS